MADSLDAAAALAWANSQSRWQAGYCLNFVWNAYGAPTAIPAGGYPNATAGWNHTSAKHVGARDAPNGFPVYFSGPDGHVALMKDTTRGILRSTYTSGGVGLVGDISIDTIVNSWGRTLLGWGGDIFGHPISGTTNAGGGSSPIEEEEDMSFIRIQSTNRGIALIGPGYYRGLVNNEEVEQSSALISKHLTGNDRQFDVWVALALQGQAAKPTT